MTLADAIYERCVKLPEAAAQEALDFVEFLSQRYGTAEQADGNADSYNAWFKAQVQSALDDPRPGIPHDEVRENFAQRRQTLRDKLIQRS